MNASAVDFNPIHVADVGYAIRRGRSLRDAGIADATDAEIASLAPQIRAHLFDIRGYYQALANPTPGGFIRGPIYLLDPESGQAYSPDRQAGAKGGDL